MNRIILMGRLTKDPDVRYTQTGKVVCQFTIAVNRPTPQNEEKQADFIPVILWGKSAELAGNGLRKGQRVLVEGRLQIRSYTDNSGTTRWITEVIAFGFEFIERKEEALSQTPADFGSFGTPVPDEEIPF